MTTKILAAKARKYKKVFEKAENITSLAKEMRGLGFKVKKSSGIAFLKKDEGFVVKIGYFVKKKFKSKHLLISHIENIEAEKFAGGFRHYYSCSPESYKFVVQPLVDCSKKSREKALDKLPDNVDLHEGNVGFYKGEPVQFDW